ncbi:helix-turn-helix protein [Clostridium algidicarnis DSM 15099]|uniref:Helix-turn-helix protein n=1 Tax=Clostridium algidicarnis DSM 15099 TaxID=1121295 RepID=A0A2S6FU24_9CLOT|nr:helix-turn-helix protein [Clostridium algidicarnis DSM 15099]
MRWLLRRFNIYPNAYYNYLNHRKYQYHEDKARVEQKIVEIYHKNNGVPGYRMMHDYLEQCNINYSCITVYKYMKELRLRSIVRRKKPDYVKGIVHKAFPNLLNQNFKVDVPNKIWCTDFTYFPQKDGTIRYNCTIIDLYDRSVVATLNGNHITTELAINTLTIALKRHKPEKGIILHSDQGSQVRQEVA